MEDNAGRQRPTSRPPGFAVGRLFGFALHLNPSWLLLAVLVTLFYGEVVRRQLHLSPAASYVVGFGFVVCLLVSVLLHELGHALTARRYGIGVRGITLELLGGYTEMDREAPSPKVDALVALAGPAVSFAIGLAAAAAAAALPGRTLAFELALQLALANLVVAAFNVLPGLPLDGGRALRAGVWALSRDRYLGSQVAGWAGRAIALLTVAATVALSGIGYISLFGLVFMLLVALTLWQGAGQALRAAKITQRFGLVDLARLARPVFPVPSGTPLAEAERRVAESVPGAALAVADSAGRLVALVHEAAAEAVPRERRPWIAVDAVARGLDGIGTIPSGLRGEDVIRVVQAHPGAEYLVTTGPEVVGVLRITDLAQVLEPRRGAGSPS